MRTAVEFRIASLTGRRQNFPDEPIRLRAEILFPLVTQRPDLDNSDGHRRPFCLAERTATGRMLFQIFETLPVVDDFEVRRCISRVEPADSISQK
jgi:hypothetical protein